MRGLYRSAATAWGLVVALGTLIVCGGDARAMPDPIAHWRLDHVGADTEAIDSSGGNDGTVNGATWTAAGQIGGALQFDGTTSSYVITNPFSGFPSTEITASYWVNTTDGDDATISYAISSSNNNTFLIFQSNNIKVYTGGAEVTTGVAVNDGAWHHVAVTWRSSDGEVKLYVDGAPAYSGTLAAGSSIPDGGALVMANEQDDVGGGFDGAQAFAGLLDDVRIYNVVLSEAEIGQIMLDVKVKIEPTDPNAAEGDPVTDTGTFTVTREGDVSGNLTVRLNVLLGDATPGDDYIALADTVVIIDGEASATITVTPVNDLIDEIDEDVTVKILADPTYNLGTPEEATVIIHDDDMPWDFTLSGPGDEGGGEKEVALTSNLQWNDPGGPTVDTYTVVMARDAGFTNVVHTEAVPAAIQWTVDSGVLEDDWRVWWKVVAYNVAGSTESNVFNFWTPDTIPPFVARFEPGDGADVESKVEIRFSEPVMLTGLLDDIFSIVEEGGTQPHPGDWASVSAYQVTFTPSEDFTYDTRYTVTVVAASVEDDAGWDLDGDGDKVQGGDYTQTFRTWQALTGLVGGEGCVPAAGCGAAWLVTALAALAARRRRP